MKESTINDTIGSLKIAEDVLEKIAGIAAKEVEGVAGIAPEPAKPFGIAPKSSKPVQIAVTNDVAVVRVSINVRPKARVAEVAKNVQKHVKSVVQSMTGIAVAQVVVAVGGGLEDVKE